MSDPSYRIFLRKIQIRVKPAAHVANPIHNMPMSITISLEASDSILGQKDIRTWRDLDWKFRPPVEIHADSEVSIVISPALSAATQSDKQVLATVSFADVLALPRRNSRRVHLQLEHQLATIRISFTVAVNQETSVPLWDSLKRRFLRHFRALFGVDERLDFAPVTAPPASDLEIPEQQPVPPARPGWFRPPVGGHVRPPPNQLHGEFIPQESHIHSEDDFNAVPVDSAKIQYTMVGTKRPKPR
ncbi:hypothetical protein PC9H_000030 [Pleurotus ostreatus]|uniref:Uncharacterized protein n=1 Tax=Pleurotus ostreatus TaxID=5322 RepID=A0A8H7A3D8_PLEOS|nr:uncharacterized protein PC9H_000030 [Pleurotus ostreatus]KAF7439694.1 hypothetical protein PC9H_000030 [Pleurotus ostreatus]